MDLDAEERKLTVWMAVTRPDGSVEQVQVGSAYRTEQGLCLQLPALRLVEVRAAPAALTASQGAGTLGDLETLARRARKILADPKRSRWHDAERSHLAAIEAELERKRSALGLQP